ncbi:Thiamine biosynthesis protein ThiI [Metamycoplasma auris 15026]|uniref:Probable tRNA sulfurtransferase n=1 Tax=Metamycoplasma auris 15026 TaxID=1188233 RepID=N9UZ95_9BACT|nr:tRNA uracil 4-sulfurtransferase ThiI [Metamycoplasma auris]ENY68517.1 Thiamine biosynthesis protein ThiI [Metamycoplasma auris 15026]
MESQVEKEILIRYGELTLKGENKKDFIKQLRKNLEFYIKKDEIKMEYDRAFCKYSPSNLEALKYIFGISSYSVVYKTSINLEDIEILIKKIANESNFSSFAINARRHNKNYHMTSSQLNMHFGHYILSNFANKKVDLSNPDLIFYIEIRDKFSYIFTSYIEGLGGLPTSCSGRSLHLISGGIDSPVAANLLQKRGLHITFLNFITPPHTDKKTTDKINDIVSLLTKYQGEATLFQINYTKIMNYIGLVSNQKYKICLMRRSFYRIAQKIAQKYNIKAISNGENLAQVASQTLESIYTIQEVCSLPILRPLLSFDKNETIAIAKKIKTMDISIIKACETCELFAPKFPVTKPNRETARELENELSDLIKLENEILNEIEIIKFKI